MQNFITALKAENIKKKGTGIYILALVLGIISPIIYGIAQIVQNDPKQAGMPYNHFTAYIEECLAPFAGFFFPLLIIITVSRFAQLDHKNGGWQLMETQPITKFSIYFSKFTLILITNLIAIMSLVAGCFLMGGIVTLFTELPKEASLGFEAGTVLEILFRLFLGGLMLSALQYLIAVLVPSFIWSIVIGFFGLLGNTFLMAFKVVPAWSPFEIVRKIAENKGSDLGYWATYSEMLGVVGAYLLLAIGFIWYRHKSFKAAFFGKPARSLTTLLTIIGCVGIMAWINKPNKMLKYSETVVSGTISGDAKFKTIYVTDDFVHDTIAVIPVVNGKFSQVIKQDIPAAFYKLVFDNSQEQTVFFGAKDSVYVELKMSGNNSKFEIKGTRLAENNYKGEKAEDWSMTQYYLENNEYTDRPDIFTNELTKEWKNAISESDKFRTADNYVPREDYLQKNKMLLTIKYLNYWNQFLKKRAAMFPGQKTPVTPEIAEMIKTVPLNDEALLSSQIYFEYLKSRLIADNKEDTDEDTKAIKAIAKLPAGSFKDKMLYWQLGKSLDEATASSERNKLVDTYAAGFSNSKYTGLINNHNKVLTSLDKGAMAPAIEGTTIDKKPFSLDQLKGKYVAIDVWATWCQPCKVVSPYFEKIAVKYKGQPIQFVALSVDKRVDQWFVDAKAKSASVLQVHANDIDKFSKAYNIEAIPRFILIDPQGNFVNADMPRPDDKVFNKLIREALKLAEEK